MDGFDKVFLRKCVEWWWRVLRGAWWVRVINKFLFQKKTDNNEKNKKKNIRRGRIIINITPATAATTTQSQ